MEKEEIQFLKDCNTNSSDCYGNFQKNNRSCIDLCGDTESCKIQSLRRKAKLIPILKKKEVLQAIQDKPGLKLKELIQLFKHVNLPGEKLREQVINILGTKVDIDDTGRIYTKNKNR